MAAPTHPEDLTVLVDFDWTLSDTSAFCNDLWPMMADYGRVSVEQSETDGKHHHADPVLGGYVYEAHIAAYGLSSVNMWGRLHHMLARRDYLYDDSRPFITDLFEAGYKPSILSFGETEFQRAKILPAIPRLLPEGSELDLDIIFERKSDFIQRTYPEGSKGVLIDDVPNQNLPVGFTEVHLDRKAELKSPVEKAGGFTVSDLVQALEVIKTL